MTLTEQLETLLGTLSINNWENFSKAEAHDLLRQINTLVKKQKHLENIKEIGNNICKINS